MKNKTIGNDFIILLARLLFSSAYIFSGFDNLIYFKAAVQEVAVSGMHWHASALTAASALLEIGCGLMIVVGFFADLAALLIGFFTAFAAFSIHHFWSYPLAQQHIHLVLFFLDLSLVGASLYVYQASVGKYAIGKGRFSLAACLAKY
ncbi:MAG TPA: DoxX family protein [Coxiellaceae bacterium]|nr:MAG: hypothetical protein A3E81_03940 [Gammaproteobacteria bacterium RIFCSPHIGHO2_12_FULL_36_30]HLB56095.1 DoxX family protein [Coxiellaceae bacterium]